MSLVKVVLLIFGLGPASHAIVQWPWITALVDRIRRL
jgi:hypothetical protein